MTIFESNLGKSWYGKVVACNQAMEHSKHSKTCSIITGCGICAPVLGSEKKIHGFWAFSPEPLLEEAAANIFSCQLCAPLAKTQTTRTAIFWPMGLQKQKLVVFHGRKQQKIRQFQLTFGGCCLLSSVCPISV